MSSSALSAVERPAPDMPVTTSSRPRAARAASLMTRRTLRRATAPPAPRAPAAAWPAPRPRKASSASSGKDRPSSVASCGSGRRSIASARDQIDHESQRRARHVGTRTMPSPRTSMQAGERRAARSCRDACCRRGRSSVWSSATSLAPWSMRRSARSDLPLPEARAAGCRPRRPPPKCHGRGS